MMDIYQTVVEFLAYDHNIIYDAEIFCVESKEVAIENLQKMGFTYNDEGDFYEKENCSYIAMITNLLTLPDDYNVLKAAFR